MSLQVKAGTITVAAGASGASVSGLAFQPRIIFFTGVRAGGNGDRTTCTFGFAERVSTGQKAVASSVADASAVTNSNAQGYLASASAAVIISGTTHRTVQVSAWASDGFSIHMGGGAATAAVDYTLNYLAIGGTTADAADVAVGTFVPASTGSNSVTGLGFQPSLLIGIAHSSTSQDSLSTSTHGLDVGFATASKQYGVSTFTRNNNATSDTDTMMDDIFITAKSTGNADRTYVLNSFDADGFTYTASSSSHRINYIAIAGIDADILTSFAQAGTGTFDLTATSFEPGALISIHAPKVTTIDSSNYSHLQQWFGFATADDVVASGWQDEDALTQPDSYAENLTGFLAKEIVRSAQDTFATTAGNLGFDSFLSNGVRLNQLSAPNQQGGIIALVFGGVGGGGGPVLDPHPYYYNQMLRNG